MAEVLNRSSAQWEPRLLADLYAAAALEADDAHGAERDVITQHYSINRVDLAAVLQLASRTLDGKHGAPGKLHQDCGACDEVLALGRVRSAVQWSAV